MDLKTISGFMAMEKTREDIAEADKQKRDAKQRIKNHGR